MIPPRTLRIALLVAGVSALAGCGQNAKTEAQGGPQAMPVKVLVAQSQVVPESTDYLAVLRSRNAAALQPQVEGDITRIFVHSGDRVEPGAPILEIDPRKQEATVINQQAAYKSKLATLQQWQTELERRKKLFAAGVIAKADLDVAQTSYDAAKADAEATEASIREQSVQLRYYTVRAPQAGIIGDIPVHVGDHVTNQTVLTTLDRGGPLEAYIYVPAEKAPSVRRGMPVDILDESGKPAVRTSIFFVSPQVDTASQTLLLKAEVPNGQQKFRNAQQVNAALIWSEHRATTIPVTAVSRLSGKIFAFIAEGNGKQTVARQKPIEVGDLIGNNYVVLDGIKPGDRIITSNVQILADNMPVIPQS